MDFAEVFSKILSVPIKFVNLTAYSNRANKLINVKAFRCIMRDITIKKWKINNLFYLVNILVLTTLRSRSKMMHVGLCRQFYITLVPLNIFA